MTLIDTPSVSRGLSMSVMRRWVMQGTQFRIAFAEGWGLDVTVIKQACIAQYVNGLVASAMSTLHCHASATWLKSF